MQALACGAAIEAVVEIAVCDKVSNPRHSVKSRSLSQVDSRAGARHGSSFVTVLTPTQAPSIYVGVVNPHLKCGLEQSNYH